MILNNLIHKKLAIVVTLLTVNCCTDKKNKINKRNTETQSCEHTATCNDANEQTEDKNQNTDLHTNQEASSIKTIDPETFEHVGQGWKINQFDHYKPVKHLLNSRYNFHIFGTENVRDSIMQEASKVFENVIDHLKTDDMREKFQGHYFLVITYDDPDVLGASISGHKNTGSTGYVVMTQELICTSAVDTIRPDNAPEYRGWDTPVHEFGHSIEYTLGLLDETRKRVEENSPGYNISEAFAWAITEWFNMTGKRESMSSWTKNYLSSVFNSDLSYTPSCEFQTQ